MLDNEHAVAQAPEQPDQPSDADTTTPPDLASQEGQGDQPGENQPEFFSDTFKPDELPEELRPAYQQMRADYTRKTQEIARYRRFFEDRGLNPDDPEGVFRALATDLGYEINDDTDGDVADEDAEGFDPLVDANYDDGDGEPVDPVEARLNRLEAEYRAERQRAVDLQALSEDLDQITARLGRPPTEDEIEFLGRHAVRDEQGRLTVMPTFDALEKLMRQREQQWAKSKEAPTFQAGGSPGVQAVDLDDPDKRLEYAAQIMSQADQPA